MSNTSENARPIRAAQKYLYALLYSLVTEKIVLTVLTCPVMTLGAFQTTTVRPMNTDPTGHRQQ